MPRQDPFIHTLPDGSEGIIVQAIYNLVATGYQIYFPDGREATLEILRQSPIFQKYLATAGRPE